MAVVLASRWHRWLGLTLLLPLLVWASTGVIFLFKPGYGEAYSKLFVITQESSVWSDYQPANVQELRRLHTSLGEHLLVKRRGDWQQLWPNTGEPRAMSVADSEQLVSEAISANPKRYGQLLSASDDGREWLTDTGVVITLNWARMELKQEGNDTRWIRRFYRWHYLQWTGNAQIDKLLGGVGLTILLSLSLLGVFLWWRGRQP